MNKIYAKKLIEKFLLEDIGTGDLSVDLVFPVDETGSGVFLAKFDGIICGTDIIQWVYEVYGADVKIRRMKKDGDRVVKGDVIAEAEGSIAALLSCERLILNLMQRMSGIATYTNSLVQILNDSSIKICDTRKTTPGLRMFEKHAVVCGGGFNHRIGLYDGIMLKDNHIAFSGSITKAVELVRKKAGHMVKLEVETQTREEVEEAVEAGADVIMFDNRTPDEIKELVKLVPDNMITEASGGITQESLSKFAGCGVDYISIGALTHSVYAADISFVNS